MKSLHLVIFLVAPFDTFHRRPMIRALAKALRGRGSILCVEPWSRGIGSGQSLRQIEPNLYVHRPQVLLYESALHKMGAEKTHWRLIARRLRKVIDSTLGAEGLRVAWLYKPEQVWLAGMANEAHLLYECYDEYRYDMSGRALDDVRELEHKILDIADIVCVTSEQLLAGRDTFCDLTKVVPNGVDFELFNSRPDKIPDDLQKLPRPRIGHIGNLMECLDLDLLRGLIESRPAWSFVHIGPVSPDADTTPLHELPNLHFLGVKPQEDLPAYMSGLDAGLMLFKQNRFTNAVDPLKLYEYLAAGIPVVSTRFASLGQAEEVIWIARDLPEFIDCLEEALTHDGPQRKLDGLKLAMSRDWSQAARQVVEALDDLKTPALRAS